MHPSTHIHTLLVKSIMFMMVIPCQIERTPAFMDTPLSLVTPCYAMQPEDMLLNDQRLEYVIAAY